MVCYKFTNGTAVNGICKGVGRGVSKQVAKEEAARDAYCLMGWT